MYNDDNKLPHWDMSVIFPGLESAEFETGFQARYDDLLASTVMAAPAELAARFGMDIRSADFWRSSLDLIRADIDQFETAVDNSPGYE